MYQPGENGQHIANGYLTLDGKEVAEIGGTYDPKGKAISTVIQYPFSPP